MKFRPSMLALTVLLWMPIHDQAQAEQPQEIDAAQKSATDLIAPPETAETRHCLPISQIRRIQTVDDQTLLFHMRGSAKYVNHLAQTCYGLKRNSFVHRTPMNSYCNMDIITVVDMVSGMQLGSCTLGKFEKVMDASVLE